MNPWLIVLLVLVGAVLVYAVARALLIYSRLRGDRLVVCPETKDYAVVEVDAAAAARKSFENKAWLHLRDCSRWDERGKCAEPCMKQITEAVDGCLVRSYVDRYYNGKECAICHKRILDIGWTEHMPAMMDAKGETIAWDMVPPQLLPKFMATHQPVCWDCHISETFRREHRDLVTDRPSH